MTQAGALGGLTLALWLASIAVPARKRSPSKGCAR